MLLIKKVCSIIYRKGAIQRSEIERLFLAAKGFNTNLVQISKFLSLYHIAISNVLVCSFTDIISDIHGRHSV